MEESRLGLHLWAAEKDAAVRRAAAEVLAARIIPFEGFAAEPCAPGTATVPQTLSAAEPAELLRLFALSLLCPGFFLPAETVASALSAPAALPGDVLRRFVNLQLSLAPYLLQAQAMPDAAHPGQLYLGEGLCCAPVVRRDGLGEIMLPTDGWTDLFTGETYAAGRHRALHSPNTAPLFARPGAVIPVGKCDRRVRYDWAYGVTLHWYQPEKDAEAACTLPGGECFRLHSDGGEARAETDSAKPWHLILHRDGDELLVR